MNTTELQCSHIMTEETMDGFISHAKEQGASENMIRRFSCTVNALYDYLPDDKTVTKERLLSWRKSMEDNGYASTTILNYVKYINRYLDYVGSSNIRFNRGKSKDISGIVFGYLKAIEPTEKRDRKDIVWRCECKCGAIVEVAATRLISGNTRSCGCLQKELLQRSNKYIDNTSLRQSLDEKVISTRSVSGYTGITTKRGKWQAYIKYKGKNFSLGCYSDIEDAVKARAHGKELVRADAMGLLDIYEEMHKFDSELPKRGPEPKREFPVSEWHVNNQPGSAAKRIDNQSGYTGVTFAHNRWKAYICHKGVRYNLGVYEDKKDAIHIRKQAEQDLKEDPEGFVQTYQQNFRYYIYG